MRVEDLEGALRAAAESQPPVRSDPDVVSERGRRRQRRRAWAVSALGIGLVVVLGVSLVTWRGGPNDAELRTSGPGAATGRWEELPAPPLSPRARVVGVWTGDVVLLVGGDTWLCPPGASCVAPDVPPLSDGAILDPASGTWRSIKPSPIPLSHAATAVLGDDVYFLVDGGAGVGAARPAFLRYSLTADSWDELPLPPGVDLYGLVAAGEVLVAYSGSDEQGDVPDQVFDPASGGWSPLAPDPLSPSFDRSLVWAEPYLYLFEMELVPQPGSEGPSVTRVARTRPGTEEWERLPDSDIISASPWYAEGDLLVNPSLGGADGGGNDWGRTYPNGGVLNTATKTWTDLPDATSENSTGVIGERGGLIYGGYDGVLLDLASMTWIDMPAIPANDQSNRTRTVVPAGRDAVAFGGEDWSTPSGELLADAWIWRTADAAITPDPATSKVSDGAATTQPTPSPTNNDSCADIDGTEPILGGYVLTHLPPGFAPDGEVEETSTGPGVDMGGESHARQRFTDPEGRWIEFDSFGAANPNTYIHEANTDVVTEDVTYPRCLDTTTGPETIKYTITVARHRDRTVLAGQEWEYGGISITGGPGVAVETLLSVASGLRTR